MNEKKVFRTSRMERWGFALFMTGQGVINSFVGSYLQLNLTDIGISAVTVGLLFLIARVWDAINDPIFGIIIDKSNLKKGKFLPWIRASNIILPISVILLFAIPNEIPMWGKVAWAFVSYLIYDIAYTICDVPIFAMTSAVTDQVHERVNIMSRNSLLSTLAMVVVMVALPQVYPKIGAFKTSIILAVIATTLMLAMSFFAKERYVNKDEGEVSVKSMVNYVKENKYLRIGFLGIMMLSLTSMTNTVTTYFAIYNLGDLSFTSILSLMLVLPAILVSLIMPALTRKFDKFHLLMVGIIGQTILSVFIYLIGYQNVVLFTILMFIRGSFFGLQMVLQLMFTGDFVEYGEYVTGKRLQGTAYSIQTFVFKFMNAVPAAIAMFILGAAGFVEGANAVQPKVAVDTIWVLFILSPVVGAVLSLPIFAKYKLRDKNVQIMAEANSGEISRDEADKLLAGKI